MSDKIDEIKAKLKEMLPSSCDVEEMFRIAKLRSTPDGIAKLAQEEIKIDTRVIK